MTTPEDREALERAKAQLDARLDACTKQAADFVVVDRDHAKAIQYALRAQASPGSDVVERVAWALHEHEDSWNDTAWEYLPEGTQALFLGQARAALAALPTIADPFFAEGANKSAEDEAKAEYYAKLRPSRVWPPSASIHDEPDNMDGAIHDKSIAEARAGALEEAAEVCEVFHDRSYERRSGAPYNLGQEDAAKHLAAAIRSLKAP